MLHITNFAAVGAAAIIRIHKVRKETCILFTHAPSFRGFLNRMTAVIMKYRLRGGCGLFWDLPYLESD